MSGDRAEIPISASSPARVPVKTCVPMVLALLTVAWVWTLPETRGRDLAAIASES